MIERAPMSKGRFNVALNLISDRFIFGIGGYTGKGAASDTVECFDILTNSWHTLNPLTRPRTGTTALSVGNRYIYLFPGLQKETWNTIEFLDLGLFGQHPDPRNFKQQKWNILSITNPDLSQCFSFASI